VGEQPRSAPLSKPRAWWVERMSPRDRRSYLIAERLGMLAERRERGEAAAIRGFLVAWRKATEGGNPAGFTLRVVALPKKPDQAVIFAEAAIVGRVKWLPVLVVPMSYHFTQIIRECGDLPMFSYGRMKATDAWGEPEKPSKRPVSAKVNIELLRIW
jgi:hypothetical protein